MQRNFDCKLIHTNATKVIESNAFEYNKIWLQINAFECNKTDCKLMHTNATKLWLQINASEATKVIEINALECKYEKWE